MPGDGKVAVGTDVEQQSSPPGPQKAAAHASPAVEKLDTSHRKLNVPTEQIEGQQKPLTPVMCDVCNSCPVDTALMPCGKLVITNLLTVNILHDMVMLKVLCWARCNYRTIYILVPENTQFSPFRRPHVPQSLHGEIFSNDAP